MRGLILLTFVALAFSAIPTDEESLQALFTQFMRDNDKVYQHDEFFYRYQIFKATVDKINSFNERQSSATFGINKFADLTWDEFSSMYLNKGGQRVDHGISDDDLQPSVTAAPETFNWVNLGDVTPVKDQGQCGSCWAFSATEAIESAWIQAGQAKNTTVKLSSQQMVDCDKEDAGCNGGNTETAYQYIEHAGGQMSESSYPYTGRDGTCKFNAQDIVASINKFSYACSNHNETQLQENMLSWGAVSICVDANDAWQVYTGGVLLHTECSSSENSIDHCVQLTGYDMTVQDPYWIVRNSWGASWGLRGYIHLQYGYDTCAMARDATWPQASP